ncbi:MAG TPA: dihydrofolate reductase [Candidatus Dormibacteraeota bacterium]|nr:dihydrofolate reductase [Candidatus Dormibacteraeota bacterium]
MIRLIAAIDRKRGIAKHGYMPWNIPEDEQFFTDQTKTFGGHVLTGGVTFRGTYSGPLKDRHNYILTHDPTPIKGAVVVNDLTKLLAEWGDKDLWVSGGSQVFEEVMRAGRADELYLTLIDADFGCDRFFPEYDSAYKLAEQSEPCEQNGFHFTYARYVKS